MIETWPQNRRRLLALALLLIGLLLIETLVRAPWSAMRQAYQADMHTDHTLAGRYRQQLGGIEAGIAATAALADDPKLAASFLDDRDDSQAAVTLQRLIKTAAADQDIELDSLRVLPPITADGVRRIGVAIDLETTGEPLIRLIHQLEQDRPLVRIDALEVQTLDDKGAALKVSLEAHGLVPETPL